MGDFERTIDNAVIDTEAARLRASGLTYQQIADRTQTDKGTAYRRVQRAIAAVPVEAVEELRQIELERLDLMLAKVMEKTTSTEKGFLFAVDRALAISERRARLLGLDAPTRQTVTVITQDVLDAEIQRLEAELVQGPSPSLSGVDTPTGRTEGS